MLVRVFVFCGQKARLRDQVNRAWELTHVRNCLRCGAALQRGELRGAKHIGQLRNSSARLRSARPQDVVRWNSLGSDAAPQGLATGAIGCIPAESGVMGYHLFYRAKHPYRMRGFAIG